MPKSIDERIAKFRADLLQHDTARLVRRYITFGDCYVLDDDQHFGLLAEVAEQFRVSTNDVVLVGSAKTGFSLAPKKRYNHFGDESDIDLAIVSPVLFDEIWRAAYDYQNLVGLWPEGAKFAQYLFRGWIRPDLLPRSETFPVTTVWWDFFTELTRSDRFGPYRIRAGLYRNWHFLETYQSICVKQCQDIEGASYGSQINSITEEAKNPADSDPGGDAYPEAGISAPISLDAKG